MLKGKYRLVPGAVLIVAALISMSIEGTPGWVGLAFVVLAVIALALANRGVYIYTKAIRMINSGHSDKQQTTAMMKKALSIGLPQNYAMVAATLMLQDDDPEAARKVLEPLAKASDGKIAGGAMTSLSMYWWMKKDYQKAIDLCLEAKKKGYVSKNIYINLLTYYLAAGKTKDFSETLKEMGTSGASSPAIVDFIAVNEMLHGNWKQAGAYLEALCNEASPAFPDPYIHFAQVHLHYGNLRDARAMMEKAVAAEYARYSVYTRDTAKSMLKAISSEKDILPFAEAAERNVLLIVNGQLPEWKQSDEGFEGDTIPGCPEEPLFREMLKKEEELDDREANTELTEKDEEWLRRHQG